MAFKYQQIQTEAPHEYLNEIIKDKRYTQETHNLEHKYRSLNTNINKLATFLEIINNLYTGLCIRSSQLL